MSRAAKSFLYIIYFVIVGVLASFILTSFKSNPPQPVPGPAHSQSKQPSAAASGTGAGSASKTPPATNQSGNAANSSTALTNTGPGNVISLFVVASITGATAYREVIIRSRRPG